MTSVDVVRGHEERVSLLRNRKALSFHKKLKFAFVLAIRFRLQGVPSCE